MKRVPFHMTLIRDQNGLGLTIAGGKGSATNSDVSIYLFTHPIHLPENRISHRPFIFQK